MVELRECVDFTDEAGDKRLAFVTRIHDDGTNKDILNFRPTINLITLMKEDNEDHHGIQKELFSHVPHRDNTTSQGRYWEENERSLSA